MCLKVYYNIFYRYLHIIIYNTYIVVYIIISEDLIVLFKI